MKRNILFLMLLAQLSGILTAASGGPDSPERPQFTQRQFTQIRKEGTHSADGSPAKPRHLLAGTEIQELKRRSGDAAALAVGELPAGWESPIPAVSPQVSPFTSPLSALARAVRGLQVKTSSPKDGRSTKFTMMGASNPTIVTDHDGDSSMENSPASTAAKAAANPGLPRSRKHLARRFFREEDDDSDNEEQQPIRKKGQNLTDLQTEEIHQRLAAASARKRSSAAAAPDTYETTIKRRGGVPRNLFPREATASSVSSDLGIAQLPKDAADDTMDESAD